MRDMKLVDSSPRFTVTVGPLAWQIAEVLETDFDGFRFNNTRWITDDWEQFAKGRLAPPESIPVFPSGQIPGQRLRLDYGGMFMSCGKWMVVLIVDVSMDLSDVFKIKDQDFQKKNRYLSVAEGILVGNIAKVVTTNLIIDLRPDVSKFISIVTMHSDQHTSRLRSLYLRGI